MKRYGWRRGMWRAVACTGAALLATLPLGGCGHNGTAGFTGTQEQQQVEETVFGALLAPNGAISSEPNGMTVSVPMESPVVSHQPVALWKTVSDDVVDGELQSYGLVDDGFTNAEGVYKIVDSAAEDLNTCRLMVAAGSGDTLTRAFVLDLDTNINAASEATVRIVLDRTKRAPSFHLCDFTRDNLKAIAAAVGAAAMRAEGDNVYDINEQAFELAAQDCGVVAAMQAVTRLPYSPIIAPRIPCSGTNG